MSNKDIDFTNSYYIPLAFTLHIIWRTCAGKCTLFRKVLEYHVISLGAKMRQTRHAPFRKCFARGFTTYTALPLFDDQLEMLLPR